MNGIVDFAIGTHYCFISLIIMAQDNNVSIGKIIIILPTF